MHHWRGEIAVDADDVGIVNRPRFHSIDQFTVETFQRSCPAGEMISYTFNVHFVNPSQRTCQWVADQESDSRRLDESFLEWEDGAREDTLRSEWGRR